MTPVQRFLSYVDAGAVEWCEVTGRAQHLSAGTFPADIVRAASAAGLVARGPASDAPGVWWLNTTDAGRAYLAATTEAVAA